MPDGSPVPQGDSTPLIEPPERETRPRKSSDYDNPQLKMVDALEKPIELKLVTKKQIRRISGIRIK